MRRLLKAINPMKCLSRFKLAPDFLSQYDQIEPNFGFNGLGKVVYYRSYSRLKENGENENWIDTCQRVVEGTYSLQSEWCDENDRQWDEDIAIESAELMFDKIFNFKFLPSGRGLYAMGTSLTQEKRLFAALNSCAFVSTGDMQENPSNPFTFLFDMSMLGVGVGFDTRGAGTVEIYRPNVEKNIHVIEDSREGWSGSIRVLLDSYFKENSPEIEFDYSLIRPAGTKLKHFGGTAAGHGPLEELHESIRFLLGSNAGGKLGVVHICDIMNLIGKCVIAGNIRRTAEIALCDSTSPEFHEFLDLKNYEVNPHRMEYGWTSNNSVFAEIGMDYSEIVERIVRNGEPGVAWLDNMQGYSRLCDGRDDKDWRVMGGNPCLEQSLESYELCCLVETFPNHHESLDEFLETLELAFLYGKSVTLGQTHWEETDEVMRRNRRIGTSMSGIVQFIGNNGLDSMKEWCCEGYERLNEVDVHLSNWLGIEESVKKTSVKPSGTLSLVAGATPGIHHPESKFYIRRLRITKQSELIEPLKEAGYFMEEDVTNPSAYVVDFPVSLKEDIRTNQEVGIWEKMSLTAFFQKYWADNQVSCTITFDRNREADEIEKCLDYFQYQLKGISFLPMEKAIFPQMPYEEITEGEYNEMMKDIKFLDLKMLQNEKAEEEKFCSNDTCQI